MAVVCREVALTGSLKVRIRMLSLMLKVNSVITAGWLSGIRRVTIIPGSALLALESSLPAISVMRVGSTQT